MIGSLPWFDPAQLKDPRRTYDEAADIYSLGMVFYEMASRLVPFEDLGLSPSDLLQLIISGGAPSFQNVISSLSPRFVSLIKECTLLDPNLRPTLPQIIRDLGAQLNEVLVLEPQELPSPKRMFFFVCFIFFFLLSFFKLFLIFFKSFSYLFF